MKLTVRIYMQPDAEFQIDAEPSDTIGDLKANIGVTHGYDAQMLNIIFCGQGLANDKTLDSCRISEKGFIVMSISRHTTELPVPEQLDVIEYTALTEEEVSEYLGTGSLKAALQPRTTSASVPPTSSESTTAAEGEATTDSDLPTTSASTFKYRPLSPTAFDAELTYEPSAVSTFKYKPMSSSASVSEGTSSHVPPTTNVSTFKYQPISSSAFDDDRSARFSPISTASTFEYKPMSSSAPASEGASSAAQSTTNPSTFKYKPMSPSAFDAEMTSGPVSPISNVSTFRYRPLSSPATAAEGSSSSVPPTSNVSTFKYQPLSSSSSVGEGTSRSVPGSTITSSSQSTFKYASTSSSGRTLGSTSTHIPGSVQSAGRPLNLSLGGSTLGAGTLGAAQGGSGNSPGRLSGADIAQFRELITQNPELRQHFIQQISQEHPELGQSLTQNPDLLLQVLEGMTQNGNGSAGSGVGPRSGSGAQVVRLSVTPAEQAAIERLEGLGFPKEAVIEAYFACDKNEELAANYLLENA